MVRPHRKRYDLRCEPNGTWTVYDIFTGMAYHAGGHVAFAMDEEFARRFRDEMRERLQEFALSLHPEKTRLIEFGRFAAAQRGKVGLGKPATFNFSASPSSAANPAGVNSSSSDEPGGTACRQD